MGSLWVWTSLDSYVKPIAIVQRRSANVVLVAIVLGPRSVGARDRNWAVKICRTGLADCNNWIEVDDELSVLGGDPTCSN